MTFWISLVGDMITEEALPTYESWLLDLRWSRSARRRKRMVELDTTMDGGRK